MADDHTNPHLYESWQEAPEAWRSLSGVRLTLTQLNAIVERAYALGVGINGVFTPNWGMARTEFRAAHEIKDGQWLKADGSST